MSLTEDYVEKHGNVISTSLYSARRFDYIVNRLGMCNGSVLVVGFGHPYELEAAKESGFDVKGIDRDMSAVSAAKREGFDVVQGDAGDPLPFRDESVDLVVCHHVIEHIEKPEMFISETYRVLKANGILALETPDLRYNRIFYCEPTHISPFTRESLEKIVESRFSIVWSQLFVPVTFLWRYSDLGFRLPNVLNLRKTNVLVVCKKE